jgi:hypothetical protein
MATQTCMACDSPGDGNCRACHGTGKFPVPSLSRAFRDLGPESNCALCGGTGICQPCGGMGETEIGGEGG